MRPMLTRWWLQRSLLQKSLLVSLALHMAVLALRIVSPQQFDKIFSDNALEVVLVNARSEVPPVEAQAVAQASLAGGGEAAQGMASTMMANAPLAQEGDLSAANADATRQNLQQQQNLLLSRVKQQLAALTEAQARSNQTAAQRAEQEKSGARWSNCWPRLKTASTRKTPVHASATSVRL